MLSSIIWFFVISCILSIAFFLLGCYYLNMAHGNRKIMDSYSKVQIFKILAGCIFWWVTVFVIGRNVYAAVSKPVVNVIQHLIGEIDEKTK